MATLGASGFSCAVFSVKPLQPWRRPVIDEAFRDKRCTQKKPLIPKVQNGLFQARISLLAKCPSNEGLGFPVRTQRYQELLLLFSVASELEKPVLAG